MVDDVSDLRYNFSIRTGGDILSLCFVLMDLRRITSKTYPFGFENKCMTESVVEAVTRKK
jgi:hypothetical protein